MRRCCRRRKHRAASAAAAASGAHERHSPPRRVHLFSTQDDPRSQPQQRRNDLIMPELGRTDEGRHTTRTVACSPLQSRSEHRDEAALIVTTKLVKRRLERGQVEATLGDQPQRTLDTRDVRRPAAPPRAARMPQRAALRGHAREGTRGPLPARRQRPQRKHRRPLRSPIGRHLVQCAPRTQVRLAPTLQPPQPRVHRTCVRRRHLKESSPDARAGRRQRAQFVHGAPHRAYRRAHAPERLLLPPRVLSTRVPCCLPGVKRESACSVEEGKQATAQLRVPRTLRVMVRKP